jgi:hypothetical protein
MKKEVRTTIKAVGRKKESILMKTKIRNSISGLFFIPLLLCGFALLPSVQAAPDPAPPPGANTRDGATGPRVIAPCLVTPSAAETSQLGA